MSTSRSCHIYSRDDDTHDESCLRPDHDPQSEVSSASRPLFYTITMSSGSSGADTLSSIMSDSDGLSLSEPSTRAGTPPETPATELRGRSLLSPSAAFPHHQPPRTVKNDVSSGSLFLPPVLFVSPASSRFGQAGDADVASGFSTLFLELEDPSLVGRQESGAEVSSASSSSVWAKMAEGSTCGEAGPTLADTSADGHPGKGSPNLGAPQTIEVEKEEEMEEARFVSKPSLLRSRRPPPLDLSVVSGIRVQAHDKATGDSVVERDSSPDTPVRRLHTAPFASQADSDMSVDLPRLPATAPCPTTPKAPLIRPSTLACERSPSPLTLPSPCLSWALESTSRPPTASSASTAWSPTLSLPSFSPRSGIGISNDKSPDLPGSRRRASLSQKIATLRASSARGPIPPSLRNSPVLSQLTLPRSASGPIHNSPVALSPGFETSNPSSLSPPPSLPPFLTVFPATPFRRHRNPFFSEALPSSQSRLSSGVAPLPFSAFNPYFATVEPKDFAFAG